MPSARPHALRRRLVLLLVAVLCLVGSGVELPVSGRAPGTARAAADTGGAATYDRSVRSGECALLGRVHSRGLGCARSSCVRGAVPWRKVSGAEACALAGQPKGYGFATTVPVGRCLALHRRWISSVNYCASQPDRSVAVLTHAPQCTRPASVYVTLSEVEGHYDECLTPARAASLSVLAAARGASLADEVTLRSRTQCADRPAHAWAAGRCGPESSGRRPAGGGVLLVGDSVGWRGSDELARLQPRLAVDSEPARRPNELGARLDAYRARHGQPSGLIVELGTNPAPGLRRRDLAATLRTLPAATPVLFVVPYVEAPGHHGAPTAPTWRFGGWMRSLAAGREHGCVADWPAYVRTHPGLLQDGIHVRNADEIDWARWLSRQWQRC
jgi:hypothetical protein